MKSVEEQIEAYNTVIDDLNYVNAWCTGVGDNSRLDYYNRAIKVLETRRQVLIAVSGEHSPPKT